jgi:ferrous iron transport protein A
LPQTPCPRLLEQNGAFRLIGWNRTGFQPLAITPWAAKKAVAHALQKQYCLIIGIARLPFFERRDGLSMKKIIPMRQMSDNQKGIIRKIAAKGDMGRRIREMGLVPDAEIQIQGRAPLRDPVAVKIKDFTLTLRNNEANQILVEVDAPSAP